jgi:molybdate transport system permease protein
LDVSRRRNRESSTWLLAGAPLLLFLAIPVLVLAATGSFPKALAQLQNPESQEAIWISLKTTSLSVILIVLFGLPLAYWIAKGNRFYHRWIEVFCELPVALPPAAAGVALLVAFGPQGVVPMGVSFTQIAVVMAQCFVAAPFFLRAAISAFADQPEELFSVAEVDGANSWRRFQGIALPIAGRSLLGGVAIAWARAAGEFGATMIFAGNYPGRTQTIPLAIYLGFETNFDQALALSVLLMLIAVVGLVIARVLAGNGRLNPSSDK